jgi:hypothetical protein
MTTHSILTRLHYEDYLLRLYFGAESDLLSACINRAYLDFNRTAHGLGKLARAKELHSQAIDVLKEEFAELKTLLANPIDSSSFDNWHKAVCQQLIGLYSSYSYTFFVGQAQKWVNMTLKYIYTFSENRIAGFETAYPYCHIPFDNIILDQLASYGFPIITCAWSRLDDYGEYLSRQTWIRQKFVRVPLDVEFLLWLGQKVEVKG